ncbi:hypothetical protein ACMSWX_004331 [Cronobacter dublinensis]
MTISTLNKTFPNEKGTTPHPPAGSGSQNFFSFEFLQTVSPARATAGQASQKAD